MAGALDVRVYAELARLCEEARRQLRRGDASEALATYLEAWELLPDPWEAGEAAACVLSGLADVLMARGDVAAAATALRAVERALGATGSGAAAP